jgi:hypothetical protein
VVKPLAVLVDTVGALLQVQKLLQLTSHEAHRDVVPAKSFPELSPRDLVAILDNGGVVHQPSTGRLMKLLSHVQSLLIFSTVQESKLGLDGVKPFIHLQWIRRLSECWRVRHQEVHVGGVQHLLVV